MFVLICVGDKIEIQQQLLEDFEDQKRAWESEKDRLQKLQKELETKLHHGKIKRPVPLNMKNASNMCILLITL